MNYTAKRHKLRESEILPSHGSLAMTAPHPILPVDTDRQTYVAVHSLSVGGGYLPDNLVFQDCKGEPDDVGREIPVMAFMITHPVYGRTLFDLGMRKVGGGKIHSMIPLSRVETL